MRPRAEPLLVLAATAAMTVLLASRAGGALQVAAVLLYLALAPGLPFTPARPGEPIARAAVAAALSFAIDALVVTALLAAGAYDPAVAVAVVAGIAAAGSVLALRAAARSAQRVWIRTPREGSRSRPAGVSPAGRGASG